MFICVLFQIADKMTTMGDRVLNIALPKIGEKSLFTKDLEDALKAGTVDFIVHSLKDLPTTLPDGMTVGAILEREDPHDVLILSKKYEGKDLNSLPKDSIIGTSSLRRTAQLSRKYPHLKVQNIRGNLNTRLAKLDANDSVFSGIILARAGIVRLGWHNRISQVLTSNDIMYAVGQGSLAVECRTDDDRILEMLQKLSCLKTICQILSERSFLKTLGGGCSAPVAVTSLLNEIKSNNAGEFEMKLVGGVWSLDGETEIINSHKCILNLIENDVEYDDIVPYKKAKLDTNADIDVVAKQSPPRVIDHSSGTDKNLDVAGLIKVHGEAFKKCPFSGNIDAIDDSQNEVDSTKCPVHFSIGEDVMGECPFFNTTSTSSKVKLNDDSDANNKDVSSSSIDKCPIARETVSNETISKCPFLATSSTTSIESKQQMSNEENHLQLYCGIYPHKCWSEIIYQKCEKLGKDLATLLINNGALKVMQIAQNEIRTKS